MFKHYFKTALRFFWRQKGYTLLNLLGLSVGLACAMLIILWVQYERSFDRSFAEGDQVHIVMRHSFYTNGQVHTWPAIPKPLAGHLKTEYPEISHTVLYSWNEKMLLSHGEEGFREDGRYVGPDLFRVMQIPLLEGNMEEGISSPKGIAISQKLAKKYFGADWQAEGALGKTLRLNNQEDRMITAVFEDLPVNSSFTFDFLLPIQNFIDNNEWVEEWGNNGLRMMVRVEKETDIAALNEKIRLVINENNDGGDNQIFLQALTDIHLYNDYKDGQLIGGRIDYVTLFSIVALFILLIAAINFMNLATARSSRRAKEIGIRKVVGATQSSLVAQFLGEAILISLMALVIAGLLVEMLLPPFNDLLELALRVNYFDPAYSLIFLTISLVTGLIAGLYPAFFLSNFKVTNILKGAIKFQFSGLAIRKGLVIFQFATSILLIIGTVTVVKQVQFLKNTNLGLDKEQLIYLTLDQEAQPKYRTIKQELGRLPGIQAVTSCNQYPFSLGISTGGVQWDNKDPEADILFTIFTVDYNYPETMGMDLLSGRFFSEDFGTDSAGFIINEAAARVMEMEDPVGQRLDFWQVDGKVIGLVKDFHFSTLHAEIEPLIMRLDPTSLSLLLAKTEAGKTEEAIASLEKVHQQFSPAYPFAYSFLDEEYEKMYKSETVVGRLAYYFAFMAIFISCLGLLGLASFTAEQRTKEIGIRKILGASVPNLVVLLSKEFTVLILVAFILAAPLAWYFMRDWLQDFAYHIPMGVDIFLVAGGLSVLIAWLTIGYQSLRAAQANPVKALRSE